MICPLGFQIGTIGEWRTGSPFSAFTNTDSNGDGQFTDKPIIGGDPSIAERVPQLKCFQPERQGEPEFQDSGGTSSSAYLRDVQCLEHRESLIRGKHERKHHHRSGLTMGPRGQTPLPTFRTLLSIRRYVQSLGSRRGRPHSSCRLLQSTRSNHLDNSEEGLIGLLPSNCSVAPSGPNLLLTMVPIQSSSSRRPL